MEETRKPQYQKNKSSSVHRDQSLGEEIANAITHGIGAALSIAGLVLLVIAAAIHGDAWYVLGFSLFGSSAIILYLSSTLYHALSHPKAKAVFKVLDHSTIYILIAGSYSAFLLPVLRGHGGMILFWVLWGFTLAGILYQTFLVEKYRILSTLLYIAMGWSIVSVWPQLFQIVPLVTILFLIAGGLSYTIGTIFYALDKRFMWLHSIWHLFVIGGTVCHFFAAMFLLA